MDVVNNEEKVFVCPIIGDGFQEKVDIAFANQCNASTPVPLAGQSSTVDDAISAKQEEVEFDGEIKVRQINGTGIESLKENESKKEEAATEAKTIFETTESPQASARQRHQILTKGTSMIDAAAVPAGKEDSPQKTREVVSDHFNFMERAATSRNFRGACDADASREFNILDVVQARASDSDELFKLSELKKKEAVIGPVSRINQPTASTDAEYRTKRIGCSTDADTSMSPTACMDEEKFNILDVVKARSTGNNEIETGESLKKKEAANRAKAKYETANPSQAKLVRDGHQEPTPRGRTKTDPFFVASASKASPPQCQQIISEQPLDMMGVVQKRAIMANEDVEDQSPLPPPQHGHQSRQDAQPGAYSGIPGDGLCRRDDIRFSLVGVQPSIEGVPNFPTEDKSILKSSVMSDHAKAPNCTLPPEDDGLAQAMPVEDEKHPDIEAQPYDVEAAKTKKLEGAKQERKYYLVLSLVFACIVVAIIVGVLSHKNKKREKSAVSPSVASTLAPSRSPSSAPSGSLDMLKEGLPVYSLQSLHVANSPQRKAWDWLENHPELPAMEEGRKRQLFAVAAFYFAFDGENWNQLIQDRWMKYEKDECLWFSSAFGIFNSEREYHELPPELQVPSCNDGGEFTSLILQDLQLEGFSPFLPPEVSLLTSLSSIGLIRSNINASLGDMLPSELIQLTTLTSMELYGNALFGPLPSELCMMTTITELSMYRNSLGGRIPSEVGRMTDLSELQLSRNTFSGSIPSELGMTNLTKLFLFSNKLTGSVPSEIGRLTRMELMPLHLNYLTGAVPSELGSLVNMTRLYLHTNWLSGSLPSEVALLKNLLHLRLEYNSLSGELPLELESLRVNGSLQALTLANNSFSGVVPEGLCSLGLFDASLQMGLSFDCGGQLCGCCWCPCPGSDYGTACETRVFVPSRDDNLWPGSFPAQLKGTTTITVNVRTNDIPHNYAFEWNLLTGPETWAMLDSRTWGDNPEVANSLHSYNYEVVPGAVYKLHLFNKYDTNFPMCCTYGFGWFSITSAVPSDEWTKGTVIWEAAGDSLRASLDIFLRVDSSGIPHHLEHLPGEGYSLSSVHPRPVLPDNVTNGSIPEFEKLDMDNASSTSMALDHKGKP